MSTYSEELEKEFQKLLKELEVTMGEAIADMEVKEIEGVNLEELERNFKIPRPKQKLTYEKINPNAVEPKYNYPSDRDLTYIQQLVITYLR